MKLKQYLLLLVSILLVGCTSVAKEKVTICEDETPYSTYTSHVQTLTSFEGVVLSLQKEAVMVFDSIEARDELITILDSAYQSLSPIEGLDMRYEIIDDLSIKDFGSFDLEVINLDTLVSLGILKEATNDLVSIINQLEATGLTCREEN